MQAEFQCSYCGEWCDTEIDESGPSNQTYVEDCQVCCQPNVLTVHLVASTGDCAVSAQRES
jgi:hypothetical protein